MATRRQANAKAFALAAARVAAGRHCSDVVVLDLKGKSPATDYFVIATGSSDRQMRTVADEISEAAGKPAEGKEPIVTKEKIGEEKNSI